MRARRSKGIWLMVVNPSCGQYFVYMILRKSYSRAICAIIIYPVVNRHLIFPRYKD